MACVRNCANCGKEFNPRGPQKNCSKECMRISRLNKKKEYSEVTRDRRLAIAKVYREENKTRLRKIQKRSVEKNKDHYRKYKRKWYEENYERLSKEQKRKYHESFVPVVKKCDICGNDFNMRDRKGTARTCSDGCGELLRLPTQIRFEVKRQLGTEPPAGLVEEATALRLLNRALRETS